MSLQFIMILDFLWIFIFWWFLVPSSSLREMKMYYLLLQRSPFQTNCKVAFHRSDGSACLPAVVSSTSSSSNCPSSTRWLSKFDSNQSPMYDFYLLRHCLVLLVSSRCHHLWYPLISRRRSPGLFFKRYVLKRVVLFATARHSFNLSSSTPSLLFYVLPTWPFIDLFLLLQSLVFCCKQDGPAGVSFPFLRSLASNRHFPCWFNLECWV